MKPLSIVAYFDGRPGHEKQTRSILQSLADITRTNVVCKKVSTSPLTYIKNWAVYFLSSLAGPFGKNLNSSADLIIGTGTHTHLPMIQEKEALLKIYGEGVRVVTCMSPETFLLSKFDLCCVPAHDTVPARKNVFVTLGPPSSVLAEKKHLPGRGLILVGGIDRKSHRWDSRAVVKQIQTIIGKNPDMQWTVSTSPRTPEDTCKDLENLASSLQQHSFYRSSDTPAGWIEEQYAVNKIVWVTADSISMVYEALSAGCSVGVLPVKWLNQQNKFQKSLTMLHEKKIIVDFSQWRKGAKMPDPPTEPFNEAMRCAREILRRWWPDRLN